MHEDPFPLHPPTHTTNSSTIAVALVQWNLTITATYGPSISGYYTEVAALQSCKCIESRHLGLDLGGCNNEVAA